MWSRLSSHKNVELQGSKFLGRLFLQGEVPENVFLWHCAVDKSPMFLKMHQLSQGFSCQGRFNAINVQQQLKFVGACFRVHRKALSGTSSSQESLVEGFTVNKGP